MTPKETLTERLRATFIPELEEQVRMLNAGLLALEKKPRDEDTVRSLFRAAHTIKGAARVAGFSLIEEACHALESVFAAVRSGDRTLAGGEFAILFAAVDALADAATRLRSGADDNVGTLAPLLPRIERLAAGTSPANTRDNAPAPAPAATLSQDTSESTIPASSAAAAGPPDGMMAADVAEDLVRVSADRLDTLLAAVGELIIATGRIMRRGDDDDARHLDRVTARIAGVVRTLRLRPFADVCEALPRAARDIAASEGREVELVLEGQDVEADRIVIDALRDPLLHLVRNAVDHGIEPPAERQRAGKPRAGRVAVAAELNGGRLRVTVSDDGAGVDEAALRAALKARGGAVPEMATSRAVAHALLAGGLSSRSRATEVSGRGVGMDIVRSSIERIGGTVDVRWTAGRGTTFTLECPPSPATLRALLIRLGAYVVGLPTAHVERLRRVQDADLRRVEGRVLLQTETGPVPVGLLAALLGPPFEARPLDGAATVAIINVGGRRAGLVIDEALGEDEIVVRPMPIDAGTLRHATGAAVLPSGRVALLLNTSVLLAESTRAGTPIAPVMRAERETPRRRVLVADDSITTRTLEQSVLEAAGYEVITAVDGEDAWRRLEQDAADAVIADVEMPRMDGFALCRRIRASPRLAGLPIVLVTGLASDEDRARGMEAGADAYIVKSGFDQATLLETIDQLIGEP
jgi:two-component system, chemotaxis family, sensor kinase CheA